MFWEIFVYSYLITSGIALIVMPIRTYRMGIGTYGKRKSIVTALMIAFLCLFPYIGFCAMLYVTFSAIKNGTKEWINRDPTAPKNVADPNFIPPPKKEKKPDPVKDRFEILDL